MTCDGHSNRGAEAKALFSGCIVELRVASCANFPKPLRESPHAKGSQSSLEISRNLTGLKNEKCKLTLEGREAASVPISNLNFQFPMFGSRRVQRRAKP